MTNKKEKTKKASSSSHTDTALIAEAKKQKRREVTHTKLRQKRIAQILEDDPDYPPLFEPPEAPASAVPNKDQSNMFFKTILTIIKNDQETVRGRALIARLNNAKLDCNIAKKRAYTLFYQSIGASTSLLNALKKRPEFASEIVTHIIKEQEKQVGFMMRIQKEHKETMAKLAKVQATLLVTEKFIYTAEENLLSELCNLYNTAPTRLVMNHKVMGGMNPVNTIMSPKANPASPFTGPKSLDISEKFGSAAGGGTNINMNHTE
jgi:hypothetical protein